MNAVTGLKHFANNLTEDNERPLIDNIDMKLFYVYNHQRGQKAQKDIKKKKKKMKSAKESTHSKSSDQMMKVAFSVRELANLPVYMLNQMIFTFQRKMTDEDMTKVADYNKNLDKVIKNVRCLKGIQEDYIPTFKFFQFKKSFVKDINSDHERVMLTFNDIS